MLSGVSFSLVCFFCFFFLDSREPIFFTCFGASHPMMCEALIFQAASERQSLREHGRYAQHDATAPCWLEAVCLEEGLHEIVLCALVITSGAPEGLPVVSSRFGKLKRIGRFLGPSSERSPPLLANRLGHRHSTGTARATQSRGVPSCKTSHPPKLWSCNARAGKSHTL